VSDKTVQAFVLLSPEGIPIRYHESLSYDKALIYAGLMTAYHARGRYMMNSVFGDEKVINYRFRTSSNTEIIMTVAGEYLLVVIQNFKNSN
jgi:hypothetical protein